MGSGISVGVLQGIRNVVVNWHEMWLFNFMKCGCLIGMKCGTFNNYAVLAEVPLITHPQ